MTSSIQKNNHSRNKRNLLDLVTSDYLRKRRNSSVDGETTSLTIYQQRQQRHHQKKQRRNSIALPTQSNGLPIEVGLESRIPNNNDRNKQSKDFSKCVICSSSKTSTTLKQWNAEEFRYHLKPLCSSCDIALLNKQQS